MYTHGFNFIHNNREYYAEAYISTNYYEYGADADGGRGEMRFDHIIEDIIVYDETECIVDNKSIIEAAGEHFDKYEENLVDWQSIEEEYFN